jgi:hypothetical protein
VRNMGLKLKSSPLSKFALRKSNKQVQGNLHNFNLVLFEGRLRGEEPREGDSPHHEAQAVKVLPDWI